MNGLSDLVRESLTNLTDSAEMPSDLGQRAVAAGRARQRRRRRLVTATAVVAVAAVAAVPVTVLSGRGSVRPAAALPANAVFAIRHTEYLATSDAESDVHRWDVLDPETGDYRSVLARVVSEPSADLRYALVVPKGDIDKTARRIGRYETTSGEIRWFNLPVQADEVAISPDGRYGMALDWTGDDRAADIAVVDLTTGKMARFDASNDFDIPRQTEIPSPPVPPIGMGDGQSRFGKQYLSWAADSRHLLYGRYLIDLDGELAGELPVPDARILSINPNDAAMLVYLRRENPPYAVFDRSGTIRHRFNVDIPCTPTKPATHCVGSSWPQFIGWRGTHQILVQTGPGSNATYLAIDTATGDQTPVHPPRPEGDGVVGDFASTFMVVICADRLSPTAYDRAAF